MMSSGQKPINRHAMDEQVGLMRDDAKTERARQLIADFDSWFAAYDATADIANQVERDAARATLRKRCPSIAEIEREIYGESLRTAMTRRDRSDVGNRDGLSDMVRDAKQDTGRDKL